MTMPALETRVTKDDDGTLYSVYLHPYEIAKLAKAIAKAGGTVNGYAVQAVMIYLAEKGDPAWAEDLEFDSENDAFVVRCPRKAPLKFLIRRLEKRLANPAALRRAVRAARPE